MAGKGGTDGCTGVSGTACSSGEISGIGLVAGADSGICGGIDAGTLADGADCGGMEEGTVEGGPDGTVGAEITDLYVSVILS